MAVTEEHAVAAGELAPVSITERIEALDVIRGFALLGIFLMNVEWFTNPISELGRGLDTTQTGLSYAASWFIYTFVQGKFWTMFSLLFGMGFAVMLTRAQDNARTFATPYVRRIISLFAFGAMHFVLVWTGDILHNYAIAALGLLLIVTRGWKAWAGIVVSIAVVGVLTKSEAAWINATFMAVVAVLMFVLNRGTIARYWKIGVGMFLLPGLLGLAFVGVTTVAPSLKPKPPTAEKIAERMAERKLERAEEVRINTTGTYAESVRFRGEKFVEDAPQAAGLAIFALPMFMIGFWFVRAGVITDLHRHLPLFRRLLSWTLPVGLALTIASVLIFPSFPPGSGRNNSAVAARMLFELGALPLCMGYVSALVCLLATDWGARLLAPLRHAGRMALTNYIGASVIGTLYFAGYGLGHFGQVSRAGQVLFVAVVFTAQVIFSALWLSRFRYGPMEWLWRAVTYWQIPPMRREAALVAAQPATAG